MAIQTLVVTLSPPQGSEPARVANAAATHMINELVILTFGYFHPGQLKPPAAEEQPTTAEVTPFAQIAMPRSVFGPWLQSVVSILKGLPDRESFGWNEIERMFKDVG